MTDIKTIRNNLFGIQQFDFHCHIKWELNIIQSLHLTSSEICESDFCLNSLLAKMNYLISMHMLPGFPATWKNWITWEMSGQYIWTEKNHGNSSFLQKSQENSKLLRKYFLS